MNRYVQIRRDGSSGFSNGSRVAAYVHPLTTPFSESKPACPVLGGAASSSCSFVRTNASSVILPGVEGRPHSFGTSLEVFDFLCLTSDYRPLGQGSQTYV
jgi:hypothetical protein